jgi:hypothetical protein
MKYRQKWVLLFNFPRICAGSHKLDFPCSGSQGPAVLISQTQSGRRGNLVPSLGYKLDEELYGHEIARDIQQISSNCDDIHCPNVTWYFQDHSPAICVDTFNKINHNGIIKQCTIICNTFKYIQQTMDSVDWPNDRNQTLFSVNSLFDCFWNLISRWSSDRCMQIFEMKPWIVACYNMIKLIPSLVRQNFEKFRRKCNPFDCWLLSKVCRTKRRLNFFNSKTLCNICKHITIASLKWA